MLFDSPNFTHYILTSPEGNHIFYQFSISKRCRSNTAKRNCGWKYENGKVVWHAELSRNQINENIQDLEEAGWVKRHYAREKR